MVHSTWRGVKYARQHVVPANPRTTAQVTNRNLFSIMSGIWKAAPALLIDPWNAQAKGNRYTGRNHFIGQNQKALGHQTTLIGFLGSPGNGGGLPPATFTATNSDSADSLTATFTLPALLSGWSATEVNIVAFAEQDDPTMYVGPMVSGQAASPTLTVTVTGLDHSVDNIVSGWITYTNPKGQTVYGPSLTVLAAANP
jgi:hypothetical protein